MENDELIEGLGDYAPIEMHRFVLSGDIPSTIKDKDELSVIFSHSYATRISWSGIITKLKPSQLWNMVQAIQVLVTTVDPDDEMTAQVASYILCKYYGCIPIRARPELYDLSLNFFENWESTCEKFLFPQEICDEISFLTRSYLNYFKSKTEVPVLTRCYEVPGF